MCIACPLHNAYAVGGNSRSAQYHRPVEERTLDGFQTLERTDGADVVISQRAERDRRAGPAEAPGAVDTSGTADVSGAVHASGTADAGVLRTAHRALGVVCVLFVLVPVILVPLSLPLGWDELVYASRFATFAHGLDVPFEAPRTRGVPVLMAPIALWSDSVLLLRCWLSLLAGGALYAGFRPWLRVFPSRPQVVPLAAAGYGGIWFVLFYAGSGMPNHYTAMGATAAVGCFLRWTGGERRARHLVGLALGLALATLMRPNDVIWIVVPLVAALFPYRPWRSFKGLAPLAAMTAGLVAAAIPWVIESEVRFGGVAERLALATDQQGGMRLQFSLDSVITSLDGPLLCRPCTGDGAAWPATLWWFALPPLVAAGLLAVRGGRRGRPSAAVLLPTAVATCAALTYVFLIDYAAPRFLFTSYALLMIPAALAAHRLWTAARDRGRVTTAAVLAVAAGHLAVQLAVLHGSAAIQADARRDWTRVAAELRAAGVGPGCVLDGNSVVIPVAYTAGCVPLQQRPGSTPDALILRKGQLPRAQRDWRVFPVEGTYNKGWRIAVPPA